MTAARNLVWRKPARSSKKTTLILFFYILTAAAAALFFLLLLLFGLSVFLILSCPSETVTSCCLSRETQNIMTSFRRQWPHFFPSPNLRSRTSVFFFSSSLSLFVTRLFLFFHSSLRFWPACGCEFILHFILFSFFWICRPSVSLYKILVLVRFWKCHFLLSLSTAVHFSYKRIYIILTEFMNIFFFK